MLPTSKTPRSAAPEAKLGQIHVATQAAQPDPEADGPRDPLEPIGPERLKQLRKMIQEGTYPSDDVVLGGLERMFSRDDA